MNSLSERYCLAAVLVLALCAAAHGQESRSGGLPRLGKISVGYTTSVRTGNWFPVRAIVENPGGATDVDLAVIVEESDGSHTSMISRATVHLPAKASVRHESYAQGVQGQRVRVDLYQGGRRVAQDTAQLSWFPPRETRVLGISNRDLGFSCPPPSARSTGPRIRFDNNTQCADLPSRWAGYEPVDAVILGPLPPEGLTVMQERAILDWVRSGGLLILNPGGAPANYGSEIERVSPVEVLGARKVEALAPLEQLYGPSDPGASRIGLTEAVLRDGSVQMGTGSLPLVASRREGAGKVVFVAFDLTAEHLLQGSRLGDLYRDLVELRGALPKASGTRLAPEAAKALGELIGAPVLPRWVLTVCLAANLALVAAVLFFCRKRREAAFAALVVSAPIVALLVNALGAAATGAGGTSLASLHVVRSAPGGREAGVTDYYALLSPDEARCDVRIPAAPCAFPDALSLPALSGTGKRAVAESLSGMVEFMDADVKWLQRVAVRPRATTLFQSAEVAAVPAPVEATASIQSDGIHFEVVNRSDKRFTDGLVAFNRNAAGLPDLGPGERAAVLLNSATAQRLMATVSTAAFRSKQGLLHDRIVRSMFAARHSGDLFDTGAQVFGWVDGEPVAVEVAGLAQPPARNAETLHVVSARVRAGEGRILLPKGAAAMQFAELGRALMPDGLWAPVIADLTLNLAYIVPDEVRGMKADRLLFIARISRMSAITRLAAFNAETGKYDSIPGASDGTFSLPDAAKYLSPVTGRVLLRLVVQPQRPAGSTSMVRAAAIEDLDLEIEGTR